MQTVVLVDFLSDEDECVSDPCQRDGKCHVDGTSYKCECTGAWEGTTCSSKCYYGESLHGVLLLRAKKTDVPPPPPGFRYLPGSRFEKNGGNVGDHVAWVACEHRHVFPADPVTTGNKSAFAG